jgi:hypothetical protein
MTLEACLPDHVRGTTTSITRITAGLSGAGVYRVEAAGRTYVLKIGNERDPIEAWRQSLEILRRAGDAGVAPRVIHHDPSQMTRGQLAGMGRGPMCPQTGLRSGWSLWCMHPPNTL